jgi:hypothetical protein
VLLLYLAGLALISLVIVATQSPRFPITRRPGASLG